MSRLSSGTRVAGCGGEGRGGEGAADLGAVGRLGEATRPREKVHHLALRGRARHIALKGLRDKVAHCTWLVHEVVRQEPSGGQASQGDRCECQDKKNSNVARHWGEGKRNAELSDWKNHVIVNSTQLEFNAISLHGQI